MTLWNYEFIKDLAREMRQEGQSCRIKDLIALAPQNDPFYTGSPAEMRRARWFAGLWHKFGYTRGVHLRRVHYQIVSQDPPPNKPNGKPYANTERDWEFLNLASKAARYLGLVAPDSFVDRRNPDPLITARYFEDLTPTYAISLPWEDLDLPELVVEGYVGANSLQPYHLEVWVEKTTMNDVLEPLCNRYRANLVTGAGEMSITAALDMVKRAQDADRPCRIFYVSDFDPAGYGMPVSVSRKVEFFQRLNGLGLDIRLDPVALTREQIIRYRLPRQPIKNSESRKGAFENVHGAGAVELDALEALHPGALTGIVEDAILKYYDVEIDEQAREQREALTEALRDATDDALEEFTDEIRVLSRRLSRLRQAVEDRLLTIDIDVREFPLPKATVSPEGDGFLYNSSLSYTEQLQRYKDYRNGEHA